MLLTEDIRLQTMAGSMLVCRIPTKV